MKSKTNQQLVRIIQFSAQALIFIAVFLAVFMVPFSVCGQVKKAERFIEDGRFDAAVKVLKRDFFSKNPSSGSGYLLAQSLYRMHNYDEAREVMELIQDQLDDSPDKMRFYIDVLIANEDFGQAYLSAVRLISQDESDPRSFLWFNKVADLATWDTLETGTILASISGINTPYNEYAPHVAANGALWFVTDINSMQAIFPASYSGQNIHLLYKTRFDKELSEVKKPTMLVRNRNYYDHDGPLSAWPDTTLHAMTMRDIDAPVETSQVAVYFIDLDSGEEPIPFRFNQSYNTGHPTFNETGSRMYFTSDRPGGQGGMDIWYCDWEDDKWAFPVNLGASVNTPGNEVFPHYRQGRLFFSSDRRDIGYGGLDIYYASEMLRFRQVTNLRHPINSARDDFSIAMENYNAGFLSSNRLGGSGGDDIYRVEYFPERIIHQERNARFVGRKVAPGTLVTITDGRGDKVKEVYVGPDGIISLAGLSSSEIYTLELAGMDTEGVALQVLNDDDEVVDTYKPSADGSLRLELLRPEDYKAGRMNEEDVYEMVFDLNGKVVAEDDTETYSEASVVLKSNEGVTLGRKKTGSDGAFSFEGLVQGEEYTIETLGVEGAHEIDIIGETGELIQSISPVGSNSFSYTRAVPAADWMRAEAVEVPEVYAAVVSETAEMPSKVVLQNDNAGAEQSTQLDEDGYVLLQGLRSKNVYSLTLTEGSLQPSDRLVLLGAQGDTSQTVRPFDDRSFRFEYILYDDFGVMEEMTDTIALATPLMVDTAAVEVPDPELVTITLTGDAVDPKLREPLSVKVYGPDRTLLTEGFTTSNGSFSFGEIPAYDIYLMEFPDQVPADLYADALEGSGLVKGEKLDSATFSIDFTKSVVSENELAEAPAEQREFTVPHIYYSFNSYYLMEESRRSLDMLTRYLRQNPKVKIEIRAYTDSRGGTDYNILLSKRRANAVKEYLINKSIEEDRMRTRGLGESALVNDCTDGVQCTEEEHAANRRTTFIILEE